MADHPTAPRGFVQRFLPWIVAAVFLGLYLFTLNPWVGANSLDVLFRISGRDGDALLTAPLVYLLTLPIKGLALAKLPAAANFLSALCAAVSVGILARCVSLLPHDRTREQRMRGQGDPGPLRIRLAWAPPVFAATLLGLQLTFWEQATTFTGEMVDLLVFAFAILCLLEYRLKLKEAWLLAATFAVGADIANNWAMIIFAPMFLMAVVWLRGWTFFHAGFLLRMLVAGLLGLTLYLLMPALVAGKLDDVSFGEALRTVLVTQKTYLLGLPRLRAPLIAIVTLLPLFMMAIRWIGSKGTSMETLLNLTAVVVLQVGWLVGNVWFAFDPAFSPRKLVYLDPQGGGLPLLTLSFTGALASGYVLGYLLLLGSRNPEKAWDKPSPLIGTLIKLGFGLSLAAIVAVPAGLLAKNVPAIRAANGPVLSDLAEALVSPLPANRSAIVLADDNMSYGLAVCRLASQSGTPNHVLMLAPRGPLKSYRKILAQRHGAEWPELQDLAEREQNLAGTFIYLLARAAQTNAAFYLHPSLGLPAENTWPSPAGPIFQLHRYEDGQIVPPPPTGQELDGLVRWWDGAKSVLDRAEDAATRGSVNGKTACLLWSRNADAAGALLQRGQRLEAAAKLFELAQRLNPDNYAAAVNLAVNRALQKQTPLPTDIRKITAGRRAFEIFQQGGPVDEPSLLYDLGRASLSSADKLVRRAAICFSRASELNPALIAPRLGFAEACQTAGQHALALETVRGIQKAKLEPAETVQAAYLEGAALFMLKRSDEAEGILKARLKEFPESVQLLDLLSYYYLSVPKIAEAIPLLEQWSKVRSTDPTPLMRLTAVFMDRRQFDRALVMLESVLRITPDDPQAKALRAQAFLASNRLTEAKRDFENLTRRFPEEPRFPYGLAQVAEKQKDATMERKHLQAFMKLADTNSPDYGSALARLNQLKAGN